MSSSSSSRGRRRLARDEEELLKAHRLKKEQERAENERKKKLFSVVFTVQRQQADGLDTNVDSRSYATAHLNDDAHEMIEGYSKADSLTLSPSSRAKDLGGRMAVYPDDTPTLGFDAKAIVSGKHPLGIIAVFDFDVDAGRESIADLRENFKKVTTYISENSESRCPAPDVYLPPNMASTEDSARWKIFMPNRSSIGLYMTKGKLSLIVKTHAGEQGASTMASLLAEPDVTLGGLVGDTRYIRLEQLVVRNACRIAHYVSVALFGEENVPYNEDSMTCIKNHECYYPIVFPSLVVRTNCLRKLRGEKVAVFVDAANILTTTTSHTRDPFYIVWDGNSHNHGAKSIPLDGSLFHLHAAKIAKEDRELRSVEELQEYRDSTVFSSVRSPSGDVRRKYKAHPYGVLYEGVIVMKK